MNGIAASGKRCTMHLAWQRVCRRTTMESSRKGRGVLALLSQLLCCQVRPQ